MNTTSAYMQDTSEELLSQNSSVKHRFAPPVPESLEVIGLSTGYINNLALKHLYVGGILVGRDIARRLRLPFPLIDPLLDDLIRAYYLEKCGGQGLGNLSDRFRLTESGRTYARQLMDMDTYTGPAPVTLENYNKYMREHALGNVHVTMDQLQEAWKNFAVDRTLLEQIGPAIRACQSCFFYGPPGNGKTMFINAVARFLDGFFGSVAVPHSVFAGGSVIRVFDPFYHKVIETSAPKDDAICSLTEMHDERWVICKQPTVSVGAELNMNMLELRFNPVSRYYEAPLQMKANGGVLIVDDFGRQQIQPQELINRWIKPLEEKLDYLTLHTGMKIAIPFEQFVMFATNFNLHDLGDDAFIRRIRYKVFIGPPTKETYIRIFHDECNKKGIAFNADVLEAFIQRCYIDGGRPFRSCDPNELTDMMLDYIDFTGTEPVLSEKLLDLMASWYFMTASETQNNNGA